MSAHDPHRPSPADVLPDDLPPADLSENARIVLARRYLKKDEKGRPVEEPEQMFWRVARVIRKRIASTARARVRWKRWRVSSTV